MGTVSFPEKPRWHEIAALIADLNEAKVTDVHGLVTIHFEHGLIIDRFALEAAFKDFTENDWKALQKHVRGTLRGGKITNASDTNIGIRSTLSKMVVVRLRSLELEMVKEAARKEGKRLSDFLRGKILQGVDEEYERERKHVQLRRRVAQLKVSKLSEAKDAKKAPQRYVT